MDTEKRDLISELPDALIGKILSFLSTKEAASTSVLSTKWRYLFGLVSNLDFDDSVYLDQRKKKVSTSFKDFVDRVLALQEDSSLQKFSLKVEDGRVDPSHIIGWIRKVLERGVSDLNVRMALEMEHVLPSGIFRSETLVRVKLYGLTMGFGDVYLPNLKTLYIDWVDFQENGIGLTKLLSGCEMLEDLVMDGFSWFTWDFVSVSVTSLKRLTFFYGNRVYNLKNVSFDTPNLVYLEFTASIANEYSEVNFDALVEAKIDLRMTYAQINGENNMVGNATDFILGICNVKILYLSSDTLESFETNKQLPQLEQPAVLSYCFEAIPLFINLTHLSIESNPKVGWESLPGLLQNSPNLETLVLQGLVHKATYRCGDEEILTCLSSSPVKVLKVLNFGDYKIEEQIKQVKHFLKTMPNLEQLMLYYDPSFEKNVNEVSTELPKFPRASPKCEIQLISDNLYMSSKWGSSPSLDESLRVPSSHFGRMYG